MSGSAAEAARRAVSDRHPPGGGEPAGVLAGLRAAVARIEGTPQRFSEKTPAAERPAAAVRPLGLAALDAALGGGWPRAGLAEVHGDDVGGIGAATGFTLALASLFGATPKRPLLWIGTRLAFSEAGRLHGPGLLDIGLDPAALVCVGTRRLAEAVWAAEEAARAGLAALAVVEVRGNPTPLGLEGTRRLHLRAREGGAPLLMLRQGGRAEATAAPLRLRVAAASVPNAGIPAFRLAVEKARGLPPQEIVVGWNVHERRFEPPQPPEPRQDAVPLPAAAPDRPDPAKGTGDGLARRWRRLAAS